MRAHFAAALTVALLAGCCSAAPEADILLDDGSWDLPSVPQLLQYLATLQAPLPRPSTKAVPRQLQAAAAPPVSAQTGPLTPFPALGPAVNQHITSDGQQLVVDTLRPPFSAIGQIRIIGNGTEGGLSFCSGSLVEPNVVLTAGHCWFDTSTQSSSQAAVFIPGFNIYAPGTVAPYGVANVTAVKVHEGFTSCDGGPDCEDYDVALMFLDTSFGQSLAMGYNSMLHEVETVYTAGYPGDKCLDGNNDENFFTCPMWVTACPLSEYLVYNATNTDSCFSGGGQSGSPMWIEPQPGQLLVIGELTAEPADADYSSDGESTTLYTEITPTLYAQLLQWIADGPDMPSANATLFAQVDDFFSDYQAYEAEYEASA